MIDRSPQGGDSGAPLHAGRPTVELHPDPAGPTDTSPSDASTAGTVLVLGIGNLLMGDEGVGVHAIRALEQTALPPSVTVVDGGTGGFHLLSLFQEHNPVILVDATMDGSPPGTVRVIKPRFLHEFPRTLTAHDIGLRDLLESAALLAPLPDIHLITVSIEQIRSMEMTLSPPVEGAIPHVLAHVRLLLGLF